MKFRAESFWPKGRVTGHQGPPAVDRKPARPGAGDLLVNSILDSRPHSVPRGLSPKNQEVAMQLATVGWQLANLKEEGAGRR